MPPSIRTPPMPYTVLAIAIHSENLDDAAVALLAMAADTIAAQENLPHVQAPAQAEARRPAGQHQRP